MMQEIMTTLFYQLLPIISFIAQHSNEHIITVQSIQFITQLLYQITHPVRIRWLEP